MGNSKFIPSGDSDKVVWLNNFTTKMGLYSTQLGLTAAELSSLQKDNAYFTYLISMMEMYRQNLLNLSTYKNMLKHAVGQQHIGALPALPNMGTAPPSVPEGVFDRVSKLVTRVKASLNYTDGIGNDLGIIAPTQTIDLTTLQPVLKLNIDGDRPHIKCSKGYADAIDLYVDRKDGAGFVLIGRLTKTDYIDVVDLPANTVLAEWDYKARYVIANNVVGVMSAIASIVVKKS
jgi:hypothetical protein